MTRVARARTVDAQVGSNLVIEPLAVDQQVLASTDLIVEDSKASLLQQLLGRDLTGAGTTKPPAHPRSSPRTHDP